MCLLFWPTMLLPFAPEHRDEVKPELGFVTLSPPHGMMELAVLEGRSDNSNTDPKQGKMQNTQNKGASE